jgi:chromosome segregation ATPase
LINWESKHNKVTTQLDTVENRFEEYKKEAEEAIKELEDNNLELGMAAQELDNLENANNELEGILEDVREENSKLPVAQL